MVQSDLLKWTRITLKRIKSLLVLFLKLENHLWKSSIFRNVTGCNSFSKPSLHFKKMANSSRKVLQNYSEMCIFCVIKYIGFHKQSVGGALKVLGKSLKTALDEVSFIVNLYSFSYPPVPRQTLLSLR